MDEKFLLSLFLLGMTLIPNYVSAETQIIEADGDYVLGDGETVSVAKEKSREAAVRNASMQAAVFVEGVLKVDNGMVSEDEITVITSNVLQLQKEPEYKNIVDDKSIIIRCHVIALIDTDNVEKVISNRELVQQMEQDNKQIEEDRAQLQNEVEYWKNLYQNATSDSERENAVREIKSKENSFTATEYFERGNRFGYEEKYTEAVKEYTKAIELNPEYFEAYGNRGNAYADLGRYKEAIRDYNKVIELNPEGWLAYYNRGDVYADLERYDEAIRDYNKAIEINPNYAKLYYNRGIAYYELEKYINAIRDYTRAIEIDPKAVNAYIDRGIVYEELGRYEDAIRDFSTAIEINPEAADAYYHRGLTYEYLKQYSEAIKDYRRVLEIDPHDKAARNNLEILRNQR